MTSTLRVVFPNRSPCFSPDGSRQRRSASAELGRFSGDANPHSLDAGRQDADLEGLRYDRLGLGALARRFWIGIARHDSEYGRCLLMILWSSWKSSVGSAASHIVGRSIEIAKDSLDGTTAALESDRRRLLVALQASIEAPALTLRFLQRFTAVKKVPYTSENMLLALKGMRSVAFARRPRASRSR